MVGQYLAQPLNIDEVPAQQCIPVDGPQSEVTMTPLTFADNVTYMSTMETTESMSTNETTESTPIYIQHMTGMLEFDSFILIVLGS